MGIASLVATGKDPVLKRLSGEVFNIWLDCFGEIKEAQIEASEPGEFSHGLRRMWENEDAPEKFYAGSEDTVEYGRRKAVSVGIERAPKTTLISCAALRA